MFLFSVTSFSPLSAHSHHIGRYRGSILVKRGLSPPLWLLRIEHNFTTDVQITTLSSSITGDTKHQLGFVKRFLFNRDVLVFSQGFVCLFLLTVNHLTATRNKESVCQHIIRQKLITLDICHIHVFVFKKQSGHQLIFHIIKFGMFSVNVSAFTHYAMQSDSKDRNI